MGYFVFFSALGGFADLDALAAAGDELREDLRAVEIVDALDIGALAQVDGVELAPCGADAAR